MGGWIHIRNWDKHQHYGNRRVPWIKLYTELLYDDDYMSLTAAERAALVGLWMLYAETRQRIPEDTAKVSRALGLRFTKRTLISLNRAGFIEVSSRQPSRPEEEEEKEPPNPQTSSRQRQLPAAAAPPVRTNATAYGKFNGEPEEEYLDAALVNGLMKDWLSEHRL